MLGERRVPQDVALRQLYDMVPEQCPELARVWADGPLPEVSEPCVVFVPDVRSHPEIDDWLIGLSDEVMVICSQEICHQVTVHFRMHRLGYHAPEHEGQDAAVGDVLDLDGHVGAADGLEADLLPVGFPGDHGDGLLG